MGSIVHFFKGCDVIEIRIHGRGGQGSVIASQILAEAAFREGMHVQAFPSFGSERRGAPVTAFLRIDHSPVMIRSKVYEPEGLLILDQTLLKLGVNSIVSGLKPGGWILLNSPRLPEEFEEFAQFEICTIDAATISRRHGLGTATAPIVNTVMAGALAGFKGIASLDNLAEAVRHAVPIKPEENVAAAMEGAREIRLTTACQKGRSNHVSA
jgi:pyruvate ferredoxin oxidoreductase gamma subunit/2-oxoisovalerate ferredoxin oxidoreductase gamma subunit